MKRKHCGYIILLLLLLLVPRDGAAALFEQLAIETRAGSLGNAVTADPQGPLSAHYNPAGLDRVRGTEFTMGIFYIPTLNVQGKFTQGTDPQTGKLWAPFGGWFNNGIDPAAGHGSSTTPSAELPHLGALPMLAAPNLGIGYHSKNSPFAFGFAVYAPFGAGMEHTEADDPYRFLGKRMSVLRLTMAPTISYRVSKSLSVGASFGLGMAYMGFDTRMRAPNDMVALTGVLGDVTTGLEIPIFSELLLPPPWFGGGLNPYEEMGGLKFFAEDNLNTSFNIGWLWEPVSWFSFGGVYQSETKADMQGKYTFDFTKRMQNTINWLGSSPTTIIAAAVLDLPTYCPPRGAGEHVHRSCPARPRPVRHQAAAPPPHQVSGGCPLGPVVGLGIHENRSGPGQRTFAPGQAHGLYRRAQNPDHGKPLQGHLAFQLRPGAAASRYAHPAPGLRRPAYIRFRILFRSASLRRHEALFRRPRPRAQAARPEIQGAFRPAQANAPSR